MVTYTNSGVLDLELLVFIVVDGWVEVEINFLVVILGVGDVGIVGRGHFSVVRTGKLLEGLRALFGLMFQWILLGTSMASLSDVKRFL